MDEAQHIISIKHTRFLRVHVRTKIKESCNRVNIYFGTGLKNLNACILTSTVEFPLHQSQTFDILVLIEQFRGSIPRVQLRMYTHIKPTRIHRRQTKCVHIYLVYLDAASLRNETCYVANNYQVVYLILNLLNLFTVNSFLRYRPNLHTIFLTLRSFST